ncbi:hypothetical protein WJX84_006131 [Apatococcus fuscideae]|uniref:FACT complex subunit SSRP1 n=1 Tax=Apatococcus fuscideae TaxID=2026836 RepID=A0AAW1SZB4_9CHLO
MDQLRQALESREGGKLLLLTLESLEIGEEIRTQLAQAIQTVLNPLVHSGPKHEVAGPSNAGTFGNACTIMQAVTCISPRGKHDLSLSGEMVHLRNAKTDLIISISDVDAIAVLDNLPKDKKGRILMVLHLKRGRTAAYNKQKLSDVVFQVSASDQLDIAHPKTKAKLAGPAVVVLCKILGAIGVQPAAFIAPSQSIFRSSTGHNCVEAIVKVNQGFLFPMPQHLLFLERPQIFIPLADIKAVDFARASGMSQTFDLHVHLAESGLQEFSHIPQAEASSLQQYMTNRGIKIAGQDQAPAMAKAQAVAGDGSGSDSEEDSDFDPDRSSGSGEPAASADDAIKEDEVDSPTAQQSSSEDEDDSEEEVELFSDEDVPASKVRELVSREDDDQRKAKRQRKQ